MLDIQKEVKLDVFFHFSGNFGYAQRTPLWTFSGYKIDMFHNFLVHSFAFPSSFAFRTAIQFLFRTCYCKLFSTHAIQQYSAHQ